MDIDIFIQQAGRKVVLSLGLLAILMMVVGCGSSAQRGAERQQWLDDYLAAMRLESLDAEDRLLELASTARSKDQARTARFERARLALRRDDVETARTRFQELWDQRQNDGTASRSLYELARISIEYDGDFTRGEELLEKTITETTPWAGSELALDYLLRHHRAHHSVAATEQRLADLIEVAKNNRMAAQLHYKRGRLLDEELRRPDDALAQWRAAYKRCRDCYAADESLYQMGHLYARYQRWESALQAWAIVAKRSDRASFVGTYASQRAAQARYEMGMVELLFRRDYDAASGHFTTYIRRFPYHRHTDDAAWHLTQIERLRGDHRAYRRALERFLDDYPDSRLAARARHQLQGLS